MRVEHPSIRKIIAELELVEVPLEAILPSGSIAFAKDSARHIVGIKYGAPFHKRESINESEVFKTLASIDTLQRLVLAYHSDTPLDIPSSIARMQDLEFLWVHGKFRSLPVEILDRLPVYVSGAESRTGNAFAELDEIIAGVERSSLAPTDVIETEHTSKPAEDKNEAFPWEKRLKQYGTDSIWKEKSLRLNGIFLSETVLEDPPLEILSKGPRALRSYLRDRAELDLPLNEVKVILVGDGGSGKTSLVKRLIGEKFRKDEPQTHGINIRNWNTKGLDGRPVKINLWDFGGQEVMHATHQFFLSKRSLYVVLLDGRKEEDAEYWLQHVESFGSDSPVLVVINKIDENPGYDVNRKFLQSKYKGISGFFRISCKTRGGLGSFKKCLEKAVLLTPILATRWPRSWFRVKKQLEGYATSASYISLGQFQDICRDEQVGDVDAQETLVDFLHDLGVIVHFRDLSLLDTHVLNPRWVTQGVYKIINSPQLAKDKGMLRLSELGGILKPSDGEVFCYPKEKHTYLIELMLKFELCYRIGLDWILVPDLLDIQEPNLQFDYSNAIRFVFQYEYLPKSIIARFIVRMNRDISESLRWRTGVLLANLSFQAQALVRADENAKRVYVFVSGLDKRGYFAVIRDGFHDLHRSFDKLVVRELVPLPDAPEISLDYQELIGHEAAGQAEIFVGRIRKAYNVRSLLDGIVPAARRLEDQAQTVWHVAGDVFAGTVGASRTERSGEVRRGSAVGERIAAYSAGFLVLGLVAFLLVRNEPIADPNLAIGLRTILSLCAAIFGASVPGMMKVDFSAKGIAVRATGALALFVLTFMFTPSVLPQIGPQSDSASTAGALIGK